MQALNEVRGLLDQIRVLGKTSTIQRCSDQIEVLCRAYMEPDQTTLATTLGLTTSKAAMFGLLLRRRGQAVSRSALMDVCPHQDQDPDIKIVDVQISLLRKALKGTPYEGKIETVWGTGYRMTTEAASACIAA